MSASPTGQDFESGDIHRRLCHTSKGGGCYDKIHIESIAFNYCVLVSICYKSKITAVPR